MNLPATIFLKNPTKIFLNPSFAFNSLKLRLFESCGRIFLALSIGPATNCGKKLTNVANLIKSLVGFNSPLKISIE